MPLNNISTSCIIAATSNAAAQTRTATSRPNEANADMLAQQRRVREMIVRHHFKKHGHFRSPNVTKAGAVANSDRFSVDGKKLFKSKLRSSAEAAAILKKPSEAEVTRVVPRPLVQDDRACETSCLDPDLTYRHKWNMQEQRIQREEKDRERRLVGMVEEERRKECEEQVAAERARRVIQREKREKRRVFYREVAKELENAEPPKSSASKWTNLRDYTLRMVKGSSVYSAFANKGLPSFHAKNVPSPQEPACVTKAQEEVHHQDLDKTYAEELEQKRRDRLLKAHARRVKREQEATRSRRRVRSAGWFMPGPDGRMTIPTVEEMAEHQRLSDRLSREREESRKKVAEWREAQLTMKHNRKGRKEPATPRSFIVSDLSVPKILLHSVDVPKAQVVKADPKFLVGHQFSLMF